MDLGLLATTSIGGAKKWQPSDSVDLKGANLTICPDMDAPGMSHAALIALDFPDAKWLYAYPDSGFWNNLPKSGGRDVADWIADYKLTKEAILASVEPRRSEAKALVSVSDTKVKTLETIDCDELYTQKAQDSLFTDTPWICLDGDLYQWSGTHYEKQGEKAVRRRISDWCTSTPVKNNYGRFTYAYATKAHVSNILDWVRDQFGVDREQVNPPGLNCANGIVRIIWDGAKASWELIPHNPKHLYTYCNNIQFDRTVTPEHCDRLLNCLEPAQQQVLIKSLAASLDLATVRKFKGRGCSKALLLQGLGNNGKDSLKVAIELLYGDSLVDCPVTDFMAYDKGSKFPLAKLEGSLLAWSSENPSFSAIDSCQSLKRAISGEELAMERKHENEQPMRLNTIFFFNINEAPQIKASLEAITSRWAVLKFNKTFKSGADPSRGEIEADSRFRYDPQFMKEKVTPALLNKMLDALSNLAIDGIDYSCTEQALETMQQEGNHLFAFAAEVGLGYQVGGRIYVNDLWEALKSWYIANATLVVNRDNNGKEKNDWYDQAQARDKNVKGANQVYPRFKELFPKITKLVESVDPNRKNQSYLVGLAITASPASLPLTERVTASPTASPNGKSGEAVTIDIRAGEAGEAVLENQPKNKSAAKIDAPKFAVGEKVIWNGSTHRIERIIDGQVRLYNCPYTVPVEKISPYHPDEFLEGLAD
jgi:putative DNA primase/helicase